VSDTKLDMFFEQIDPAVRRRVSAELSLDLTIASVAIRTAERPAATRMAKLAVVERYIDTHHQVGTPGLPGREFFRGRMSMHWGALHGAEYLERDPQNPDDAAVDLLVFRGFDPKDGSIVLLSGSPGHLIHQPHPEQAAVGLSSITELQMVLDAAQMQDEDLLPGAATSAALSIGARCRIQGAQQYLQFLAVPFGDTFFPLPAPLGDPWVEESNAWPENHGVLGSPLYVAHG
jgi:hypothetical protein